jgi:hypothetical protein
MTNSSGSPLRDWLLPVVHLSNNLADPEFVARIGDQFDRAWTRRRPTKKPDRMAMRSHAQGGLFTD